jgi:hypothetical protein
VLYLLPPSRLPYAGLLADPRRSNRWLPDSPDIGRYGPLPRAVHKVRQSSGNVLAADTHRMRTMIRSSMDVEHIARAFPRPQDSRPVRSLTYQWDGHIYRAVIGGKRHQCESARSSVAHRNVSRSRGPATGNLVLSIVATKAGVEIWSR